MPIYFFLSGFNLSIDLMSLVIIFLLAVCEAGYLIFYMKAIAKDDTSIITALFQLTPIFVYFLGLIFLHENYTLVQIISGIVIILSTVTMSIKFEGEKKLNKDKLMALFFMVLSSLILALQNLGFKVSTLTNNFNVTMFYFQASLLLIGIIFLLFKPFRKSFIDIAKNNGKKVLFFNIINEIIGAIAKALKVFGLSLLPIAFVNVFQNGTQVIIAFFMGILLTLFMPKIFHEDISKKTIIKKVICIVIAIVATIFFV